MLPDSWLYWPEDIHGVFMVLRVSRTCSVCVQVSLKESESERLFHQLDEDETGYVCLFVLFVCLFVMLFFLYNNRKVNIYEFCNRFQPGTELHQLLKTKAVSKHTHTHVPLSFPLPPLSPSLPSPPLSPLSPSLLPSPLSPFPFLPSPPPPPSPPPSQQC